MRVATLTTILLAVVLACAAGAQPAPGPQPGPPPGPGVAPGPGPQGPGQGARGPGGFNPEQMLDRMAERLGLTENEKKVVQKAAAAKMQAATAHGEAVRALGEVVRKEGVADAELRAALQKFEVSLAAYRQKVTAIDAQLIKGISLKARTALTAMGIIDNGLPPRFGQRRPGMMGGNGDSERPRMRRQEPGAPAPGAG